jgi:hypothetical protein
LLEPPVERPFDIPLDPCFKNIVDFWHTSGVPGISLSSGSVAYGSTAG